ncbi:hypothetical protein EXIGLDRAFT_112579 [Exidia glandulosa HHB12029]|uniref:Uncharacterized protein n=1 Tax=Exidia glandulosa HHB12029 TaxID=1314781 RepID=A0A166BGS9_EXIGL|nr:hypothetical protein EXIGLDRAFT_112579 [Exidia glandulosa HHB12029]
MTVRARSPLSLVVLCGSPAHLNLHDGPPTGCVPHSAQPYTLCSLLLLGRTFDPWHSVLAQRANCEHPILSRSARQRAYSHTNSGLRVETNEKTRSRRSRVTMRTRYLLSI